MARIVPARTKAQANEASRREREREVGSGVIILRSCSSPGGCTLEEGRGGRCCCREAESVFYYAAAAACLSAVAKEEEGARLLVFFFLFFSLSRFPLPRVSSSPHFMFHSRAAEGAFRDGGSADDFLGVYLFFSPVFTFILTYLI